MIRRTISGALAAGGLYLGVTAIAFALPAQLVDRAERATALVDINTAEGHASGSAFCISDKGVFATDGHVVAGSTGKIKVVIHSGEKDQQVLVAQVLGIDYQADLALLKTDGSGHAPVLVLGNSDSVLPTQEVTAFGYPFGNMLSLDEGSYPSVTVNSGKITALRKEKGELGLIQMDALVNPGNSGGPVLDADGKVIGIVESGVPGAGLNFATPVAKLKKMLQSPLVVMTPTSIDFGQRNKQQAFSIHVSALSGKSPDYEVTLKITDAKGTSQTATGKTSAGSCDLMMVPTADTTVTKWTPFVEPPPTLKFTLTLKDSQNVVATQEGSIELANPPIAGEMVKGNGPRNGKGPREAPMDPLPPDAMETQLVGTDKTNEIREINPQEHLAKGVFYTMAQTSGKPAISMFHFINGKGPEDKTETVMAKEGYVVGGIIADAGQYFDAFKVIFIRQRGKKLDPKDTYTSDWAGTPASGKQKQLAGNGERVIGMFGRKGVSMRGIGLVIQKTDSPATQPAKGGAAEK